MTTLLKENTLSQTQKFALSLLFIVPLMVTAAKLPALPTSGLFIKFFSLHDIPRKLQGRLRYILFVPLGATMIVFFRLTLGIRVLGPFRSILLAVAFQRTGIPLGLIFLIIVIGIIVTARPLLKEIRLQYFGRVSVILSEVAVLLVVTLIAGEALGSNALLRVAYFPIVVLCLTGDGFAKICAREGFRSAVWRGAMTALVAMLITFVSQIQDLKLTLLCFPELLFLQIGCIIFIAKFLDFRLLQCLNPVVPEKQISQGAQSVAADSAAVRPNIEQSDQEQQTLCLAQSQK
jgi:hypothetical protein